MSFGPVTRHCQHWLLAEKVLQRLYAFDWQRNIGHKPQPFTPAERAEFGLAVAANSTAVVIAQQMVRIQPAANDAGGQPCEA